MRHNALFTRGYSSDDCVEISAVLHYMGCVSVLDPRRRPCQAAVFVVGIGTSDDALKPGGQLLIECQERGVVGAGAGQVTHLGEQHAAIHVGLCQVGLELKRAPVITGAGCATLT